MLSMFAWAQFARLNVKQRWCIWSTGLGVLLSLPVPPWRRKAEFDTGKRVGVGDLAIMVGDLVEDRGASLGRAAWQAF